jgi:UDP-N-acetylmuramate--alanine ligase
MMGIFRRFTGLSHVHFVGIGGAGMSGIAEVLLDYDVRVTGCDNAPSEATERLASLGVTIDFGHSADHLAAAELVVRSSAVSRENPEILAARSRGIPVVRRAEMLAELMRLKYGIAISGTHGKTTTTSLVGSILTEAGLDPTVIVGGRLRASGTGARIGKSDYLVAEADEFDRSFLRLSPVVAVVTCVDRDHLDTYRDLAEIDVAFEIFADKVPFFGQIVACIDDPGVQRLLPRLSGHRVTTYGLSPQADIAAVSLDPSPTATAFTVRRAHRPGFAGRDGEEPREGFEDLGRVEIPLLGLHNVRNALAAIGVGLALDLEVPAMAAALAAFPGVHRRFERLGSWRGAAVVDDYAHHPVEVEATLQAARQAFPHSAIHAVFQPHLYSRTRDLAEDFGRALLGADHAVVTEIYPSREAPILGVTGQRVVDAARASGHRAVSFVAGWRDAPPVLLERVRPGDLVLTLGAGDVYRLGVALASESAGEGRT